MLLQSFLIKMHLFLQPNYSACCRACELTAIECVNGCPGVEPECAVPCMSTEYDCCRECEGWPY